MTSSQKPKASELTHFLCIPLVTPTSRPQLTASLASFQDDVTNPKDLGGFDLPVDAVRPVGTLHLTLGMMSFPKGEGLDKAVDMLKSLKPREMLAAVKKPAMPGAAADEVTAAGTSEIFMALKGLNSMQKVDKATVLYAPPSDPNGILQGFAESIKAAFKEAGLLAPDDRPLLLHATVVNTIYVKKTKSFQRGKKWDRNIISDAQGMLDRYEDQVWMQDIPLEKIAICRMGAKPIVENGLVVDTAYEVEAEVSF